MPEHIFRVFSTYACCDKTAHPLIYAAAEAKHLRQIAVCILNVILGISSEVESERCFGDSRTRGDRADHPFLFSVKSA